jgi:UDP-3-O-[3-hydroxymyristoyl] glucosamine N-acyltransferase
VIGEDSILCAQAGISGSTKIGSNVTLAGQVRVVDREMEEGEKKRK